MGKYKMSPQFRKQQCVLLNGQVGKVLDIRPTRNPAGSWWTFRYTVTLPGGVTEFAYEAELSAAANNSAFKVGTGVYTCSECGKKTRDTGAGEGSLGVCKRCMQVGEYVNAINDGMLQEYDVPTGLRADVVSRL